MSLTTYSAGRGEEGAKADDENGENTDSVGGCVKLCYS